MTRMRWLAVVVALQVSMLLGWAGYHEWIRATAPTIMLETRPVDPRDLLRGDYMILSYVIGNVKAPIDGLQPASPGREIWVTLQPGEQFYEVGGTSWTQPKDGAGLIVVRGRIHSELSQGKIQVDYGIEKFFVPENKGRPRFKKMTVEATVGPGHLLGIKRLLLDGKPYP